MDGLNRKIQSVRCFYVRCSQFIVDGIRSGSLQPRPFRNPVWVTVWVSKKRQK